MFVEVRIARTNYEDAYTKMASQPWRISRLAHQGSMAQSAFIMEAIQSTKQPYLLKIISFIISLSSHFGSGLVADGTAIVLNDTVGCQ